ncbi:hypothetical protein HK098_006306 [Nowakowskiella sp. JEL0407]|nr:hypothetical protein HK098_006306 [Nowakowskiella sp. JEL0407]
MSQSESNPTPLAPYILPANIPQSNIAETSPQIIHPLPTTPSQQQSNFLLQHPSRFEDIDRSNTGNITPIDDNNDEILFIYHPFTERRHENNGNPRPDHPSRSNKSNQIQDWRMRERLKTVSVALVVCLNIAIDPPDIVKTNPCAKLECWVDPFSMPQQKALETIGAALQKQYEALQPRAKYRPSLDPSVEDTKKLCTSLRRAAKDERILFHYNGHGVPRPTTGGELWVFNKTYTQYIPVSMLDIQSWLGSPCIFVYDCSNAGNIVLAFNKFAQQRDDDAKKHNSHPTPQSSQPPTPTPSDVTNASTMIPPETPQSNGYPSSYIPFSDCIQLAACGPTELLPMNPDLPADLFTCCLTTPITIALKWFVSRNRLLSNITPEMIMKIPGRTNDRRTPLGELNWIFTAITDTIAWNVLPHHLFKKLFRQDLMVAALFRNFLLAERIMRYFNCTPISTPALPPTHHHSLWQAWDLAADLCLSQLPALEIDETNYRHSSFFSDQLTAFEVWLQKGSISKQSPEQLPIVLQVLLSQQHRHRALMLLSKFLDLGPWAVNLALLVGIFPYVLKLLQSPAADLKEVLVFIWAKILAVDRSCQGDLLKDNGYTYFINILASNNAVPIAHSLSEHRAMCAFILCIFCHQFPAGKQACFRAELLTYLIPHLIDSDPILRQWSCICVGKLWESYEEARWAGMRDNVHEKLKLMQADPVPEVRAAVLFAFGALLGDPPSAKLPSETNAQKPNPQPQSEPTVLPKTEQIMNIEHNIIISILSMSNDASPLVRKELVITLSRFVYPYWQKFINAAFELYEEERKRPSNRNSSIITSPVLAESGYNTIRNRRSTAGPIYSDSPLKSDNWINSVGSTSSVEPTALPATSPNAIYGITWKILLVLSVDPVSEIASLASQVVDLVNLRMLSSSLINDIPSLTNLNQLQNSMSTSSLTGLAAAVAAGGFSGAASGFVSSGVPLKRLGSSASLHGAAALAVAAQQQQQINQHQQLGQMDKLKRSNSFAYTMRNFAGLASQDAIAEAASRASSVTNKSILGTTPPQRNRPISLLMNAMNTGRTSPGLPELIGNDTDTEEEKEKKLESLKNVKYEEIALESTFFDWSAEYFAEPQMKVPEAEDPGSIKFNERRWRRQRNDDIVRETAELHPLVASRRFDEQISLLQNDSHPSTVFAFHQFESHLAIADNTDYISIFQWESSTRLNAFHCGNPPGSRITSLKFINEDDTALLLAASDEGIVRIFKNYEKPLEQELVSAFRALTELIPRHLNTWSFSGPIVSTPTFPTLNSSGSVVNGLVCDWQQASGVLLVSGDVKMIKIWDMERELCIQDVPTNSNSALTSITSDRMSGNLMVAGFNDGVVRVYDSRLAPSDSVLLEYKEHTSSVLKVNLHSGSSPLLVSGGTLGDVRFWDVRQSSGSTWSLENRAGVGSEMTAFAVHDYAPIFACGFSHQNGTRDVRTYDLKGNTLGVMKSLEGFLGNRLGPIPTIEFHPHKLVLAVGQSRPNSSVSSFTSLNSNLNGNITGGYSPILNAANSPNLAALSAMPNTGSTGMGGTGVVSGGGFGLSVPIFGSELIGKNSFNARSAAMALLEREEGTANGHFDETGSVRSLNTATSVGGSSAIGGVFSSLIGLARSGSFQNLGALTPPREE